MFDEKYMEELTTKFKFVEIRQSIDGIYDQFEYLRYGAKFDKVCENAEKFSALPNSDFAVICTISNYNLLGIDAIDEFMQKRNWIVYYNVANTPDYLLLHNLPEEVKNYIKLPERFSDIHQYMTMEKCDLNTWKRFVDYTRLLDRNRGLSFKTTFKDLYSLVKKHGFE